MTPVSRVRRLWPLAGCLLAVGCSLIADRPPSRPVPLPPDADPGEIYNSGATPPPTGGAVATAPPPTADRPAASELRAADTAVAKRRQAEQGERTEALKRIEDKLDPIEKKAARTADEDRTRTQLLTEKGRIATTGVGGPKAGSHYNILTLSGGGAHGAYTAGVLCGWSASGCRPEFDVVTGVSAGALIACVAFAGPEFDPDLRRAFTTIRRRDVFRVKKVPPLGIGTDAVTTNQPLRRLIGEITDRPEYFEAVVAAHAKGRRLYIGTTNLDTGRFVIWDMGAIASEGTACARQLYLDILAASAAIPPLVSPSLITVRIDGQPYTEMHVDGGVTRNLFFYPPSDWPGDAADPDMKLLAGANVFTIVAGKVYDDPRGTDRSLVRVGLKVVSTLLSSSLRNELFRMETHCRLREMKSHVAAIPQGFLPLPSATDFKPEVMTPLFEEGYTRAVEGRVWNQEPAGRAVSEELARRGTDLTTTPTGEPGPLGLRTPPRPTTAPPPRVAPVVPLRNMRFR